MTKAELVVKIAANANFSRATTKRFLDIFLDVMQNSLASEGKVSFMGLGSFTVVTRKERIGHNPRTGAPLIIASARVVKFRPSKRFRESLE